MPWPTPLGASCHPAPCKRPRRRPGSSATSRGQQTEASALQSLSVVTLHTVLALMASRGWQGWVWAGGITRRGFGACRACRLDA
eukprot:5065633-Alexandrium_andersonii.AAC.1